MFKKNRPMDCKEFTRLTPAWLKEELTGKKAYEFLEHMESCNECREELHIQFLVTEGTARLLNASGFNLDEELALKVENYQKKLKHDHRMNMIIYWMEAFALAAIVFILILVFVLKK